MENVRNTEVNTAAAQSGCAPAATSGWLSSRNLLIGLAIASGAAAMFFGWDWLVAAGLATFIIALAPCAVMCALGLCMKGGKAKEDDSLAAIRKTYETQPGEPPSPR